MQALVISGISHRFRRLSPSEGQITHVLLTRSPLEYHRSGLSARLACVKHAASVRPEPGSNSPLKNNTTTTPKDAVAETEMPDKTNPDIIARIIVSPKKSESNDQKTTEDGA